VCLLLPLHTEVTSPRNLSGKLDFSSLSSHAAVLCYYPYSSPSTNLMSFLKHRPHRKDIRTLLSGHRPKPSTSSATTDDIPPSATDAYEHICNLPRRPTDPTSTSTRPRSSSALRSVLSISTITTPSVNAAMAGQARITFTQPGVQPPVYVVTSLSNPPWETLELNVTNEKTDSGDLIFARQFENVDEGSYQYKIRIGDGYWVVDESKDSGR
jgi:hypothetical protein